jgi:hypothetical protein
MILLLLLPSLPFPLTAEWVSGDELLDDRVRELRE